MAVSHIGQPEQQASGRLCGGGPAPDRVTQRSRAPRQGLRSPLLADAVYEQDAQIGVAN
jgi:hypothetical protein